jgi:hypothetical protein
MVNKRTIKVSEDFYNFLLKFGANRVKADMEMQTIPLTELPDIIVRYFKSNNDKYLELVKFGVNYGNK